MTPKMADGGGLLKASRVHTDKEKGAQVGGAAQCVLRSRAR